MPIYTVLVSVFVLLVICCCANFAKSSMHKEYDKQIDLLPNSSRIKRATKYPCPHCGGKFKLSDTCRDVQCRDCWHIYHSDYILTMYEDSLE